MLSLAPKPFESILKGTNLSYEFCISLSHTTNIMTSLSELQQNIIFSQHPYPYSISRKPPSQPIPPLVAQSRADTTALPRGWVCCQCRNIHPKPRSRRTCKFLHPDSRTPHRPCASCEDVVIISPDQIALIPKIANKTGKDGWFHTGCFIHHNDGNATKCCSCSDLESEIPLNVCYFTVGITPPKSSLRSSRRCIVQ
jgi:hypothetical protein